MVALQETVQRIKAGLSVGSFGTEAEVSNGVVLPILQDLGWPVFDVAVVAPQNAVPTLTPHGSRVVPDYQLRDQDTTLVTLEVKRVGGLDANAEIQLFEQTFNNGVRFGVLTDGREWRFYLPFAATGDQVSYADRNVYTLHFLEQDDEECVVRLERYLSRDQVLRGLHLENAQTDLDSTVRVEAMQNVLPKAWEELLLSADASIVETLAGKVSELCGFEPDPDVCAAFLANQIVSVTEVTVSAGDRSPVSAVAFQTPLESLGFVLRGQTIVCKSGVDVLVQLLRNLASADPTFLERLERRNPTNSRAVRYVARNKSYLYSTNPDKGETASQEIVPGWYVSTHRGLPDIERVIRVSCEVAGLNFGEDVAINLG